MRLRFTHEATSRVVVPERHELQIRRHELRVLHPDGGADVIAEYDGEVRVDEKEIVWTHVDIETS
jgi:hypothetical protein